MGSPSNSEDAESKQQVVLTYEGHPIFSCSKCATVIVSHPAYQGSLILNHTFIVAARRIDQ